jgi:hypothetical protein
MKTYEGRRKGGVAIVTVNGCPLGLRLDLYNHSLTGFDWGFCGSGPAQLALALLADHLDNDQEALEYYHRFKWAVIAGLPDHWTLSNTDIDAVLGSLREYSALERGVR